MPGWIGVDLDGTLAQYRDWVGVHHIGKPVPLMVERVKRWLTQGKDVRILTARVGGADRKEAAAVIREWCMEQFGVELPVPNHKDRDMIGQWDDRAVQVVTNTGRRADGKKG